MRICSKLSPYKKVFTMWMKNWLIGHKFSFSFDGKSDISTVYYGESLGLIRFCRPSLNVGHQVNFIVAHHGRFPLEGEWSGSALYCIALLHS